MDTKEFDLIVIGAGPAGYTASIRAAQLGMKVACVEKNQNLGGTCLNVGCIPSKSLLEFSDKYRQAKTTFNDIGINSNPSLNLNKMIAKKDEIVLELSNGINSLFKKNNITRITGYAKIINKNTLSVTAKEGSYTIFAKNILIATGSQTKEIPGVSIDENAIISSTGALSLLETPKHLIVIGGGAIGLELGSVWSRLGSKVTIIEYEKNLLPYEDHDIQQNFYKILIKQGINFKLNSKVIDVQKIKEGVSITIQNNESNKVEHIICDKTMISIGRVAFNQSLGLKELGIDIDDNKKIKINNKFQTNIPNIYAVGDTVSGPMLAHKAEEEAIAAVEIMNGQAGHVNYTLIPNVIYTSPELASVGLNEKSLKKQGVTFKIGKFPFLANSKARSVLKTDGLVKIIACDKTDKILGASIIGESASTLIAEIVAVMEFGGAAEDIARTCHAHPTLNEAIKEAALEIDNRSINI